MAKANNPKPAPTDGNLDSNEEARGLLSGQNSDDEDIIVHSSLRRLSPSPRRPALSPSRSPSIPRTPRTLNRVRFDLSPSPSDPNEAGAPPPAYDDDLPHTSSGIPLAGRRDPNNLQRGTPSWEYDADGESGDSLLAHLMRPKSGLRSAMSNMANSIIGAGIIGQPYALRQAGFMTGVTLLIALTFTVDWTIRLIVINSKLSGRDSFQGTVEHCFGKGGLIAISVAQWAFAFGGMVAFCVIVGDSIPHVLVAVWPSLPDLPAVGWLANRRVVVFLLVMGVSWPLSLYRDIAKVRPPCAERIIRVKATKLTNII